MNKVQISSEEHISHLMLDKFMSETCTIEESCNIKKHCLECHTCDEYLLLMSNNNLTITDKFPDYELLKDLYRKKRSFDFFKIPRRLLSQVALVKFAFASISIMCVIIFFNLNTKHINDYQLSEKGNPQWMLYSNKTLFQGINDSIVVSPNDTIQLLLIAHEPVYFALLYQDDQGSIKTYFIENKTPLSPTEDKTPATLPFSIVLDSLWKKQTIYCIATPKRLVLNSAVDLLVSNANIVNRSDLYFQKFLLHTK